MKEIKVRLRNPDNAKEFVLTAGKCDIDIDVFYNRVTIDGKSMIGVLSLDLNQVLTVRLHGDDDRFEAYLSKFTMDSVNVAS